MPFPPQGPRFLLELRRLNDPTAQDDADLEVAWYQGIDHESPPYPDDDFTGTEPFYVDRSWLDPAGDPLSLLQSASIVAGDLVASGEGFLLPMAGGRLALRRALLAAHLDTDGTRPTGMSEPGLICGVATACALDRTPNPLPTMVPADTLLEVLIVAGQNHTPPFDFFPDIDMDGDGSEGYTLSQAGGRLTLAHCADGDGTVVPLHPDSAQPDLRCPCDQRFADGYSLAVDFATAGAELIGVQ